MRRSVTWKLIFCIGFLVLPTKVSAEGSEVLSFNQPLISNKVAGRYYVVAGELWGGGARYSLLPNSNHPNYAAVFPVCEGNKFNNCILSLESKKISENNWTPASVAYANTPSSPGAAAMSYSDGTTPHLVGNIEEDASKKIPTGRTSSVWTLPSAPHNGGNQYLVSVALDTFPIDSYQSPINFKAGITPIKFNPKAKKPSGPLEDVWAYSDSYNFPEDQEFRLKIKLGVAEEQISTFFSGRIVSPELNIENGILTISGAPQKYPIAQSDLLEYKNLTQGEKDNLEIRWGKDYFKTKSAGGGIFNTSPSSFSDFTIWESRLKQLGLAQSWLISSMNNPYDCKVSTIAGFVSGNALLFSKTPPSWDKQSSTLNYKMASLHRDSSGTLNRGNFDLALSPELTKCLWKINPKEIQSVSVQIIYNNGESAVGTSSLKLINDWVYVNVKDYTFSSPTLSIKLLSKSNAAKTKSLKCVKGKATLTVTGIKPICPAGYKKK